MRRLPGWLTVDAAIALGAGIALLWMIDDLPGVSRDSTVYVETARNVVAGRGFVIGGGRLLTHFPPLYPLALAASGLPFSGDVMAGSRLLCTLLFFFFVLEVGLATHMVTRGNGIAAVSSSVFVLVLPNVLRAATMIWSEVLFLCCMLACFHLAASYIARGGRWRLLASTGAAMMALLTRYVGITVVPAAAAAILVLGARPKRAKIRDSIVFLAGATAPLALWLLVSAVGGKIANRRLGIHLPSLDDLASFVRVPVEVTLPLVEAPRLRLIVGVIVLLAGGFAMAIAGRKTFSSDSAESDRALFAISILFCLSYVAGLIASLSFVDAATPLDGRILLPFIVMLLIAGFGLATALADETETAAGRHAATLVLCVLIVMSAPSAVSFARTIHDDAYGYTSKSFRRSPTIAWLRGFRPASQMYSNESGGVEFALRRRATVLPYRIDPVSGSTNQRFENELASMCENMRRHGAVLVLLAEPQRTFLPAASELESRCGLERIRSFTDGAVYVARDHGSADSLSPSSKRR